MVVNVRDDIAQLVAHLVDGYGAETVILYGSAARGQVTEDSDIDLVVVKKTGADFFDRLREVADICRWHRAVDVLVYTPEEFAEMRRHSGFIRDEVLKKGIVLHGQAA